MSTTDPHPAEVEPDAQAEPKREVTGRWFIWIPTNIGFALFLALECAYGLYGSQGDRVEIALWLIVSTVLIFNAVRRSPAVESDTRWWVWLICTLCTVRFLAFEYNDESRNAYWALFGLSLLADTSQFALGRSFSLMPARRAIRVGWMYRIVRHPIYTAYMLLDIIYIAHRPTKWNFAVFAVGVALFTWRALLEERLLRNDPQYREYAKRTRWRFIPFVY